MIVFGVMLFLYKEKAGTTSGKSFSLGFGELLLVRCRDFFKVT